MSIPDERLSTETVWAPFLSPDDRVVEDMEDWERGGIAVSDPSQGLRVQDWRCFYEAGWIQVAPEGGAATPVLEVADVTQLSFAFDQNMRPQLAFTAGGAAFLYWYDTVVEGYAITELPGAAWPRLALDDKRSTQTGASDVVLAYLQDGNLYARQQRDRYGVAYLLAEGVTGRLRNMGMNEKQRLQWELGV